MVPLEVNTVRFIDNFSTGGRGAACTEQFLTNPNDSYAVLLLRRAGSICPFARHVQRYLSTGASGSAGNGFDLSLLSAVQSIDPITGQLVLAPPSATEQKQRAAAAAALQKNMAAYQAALKEGDLSALSLLLSPTPLICVCADRLLSFEFTSITEYLFQFRAAAIALAPLKARAALFLAAVRATAQCNVRSHHM
jgi:hypothetical protein